MKAAGKGQAVAVSSPLPSILIGTRRKRHAESFVPLQSTPSPQAVMGALREVTPVLCMETGLEEMLTDDLTHWYLDESVGNLNPICV